MSLVHSAAKFLNLDCDDRDVAKTFLTRQPGSVGMVSMKIPPYLWIRAGAATVVFTLSLATVAAATTHVIFSFGEGEGEYADTDLETDSAGNIYGTTVLGGDFGSGTVFQLSSTTNGWVHTVLYSFTGGADEASRTRSYTGSRR